MTTTTKINNAPVVELVVGFHFNGTILSHQEIYSFYDSIKNDFPIIQEHPPIIIDRQFESAKGGLLPFYNARKFFLNSTENKLIQIQLDKVFFNWRKTNDGDQYPHFDQVLKEFIDIVQKLKPIEELAKNIAQLEVTYLDHIWVDQFGRDDFNPNDIFNLYNIKSAVNSMRSTFLIPDSEIEGNISFDLKSGFDGARRRKLFVLETNCRGILKDKTIEDWFDCAHRNIHNLFFEITTDNAKSIWGI